MKLKGLHFAGFAEIQGAVIDNVKKVQKEESSAAFQKLYYSAKSCMYDIVITLNKKDTGLHQQIVCKKM